MSVSAAAEPKNEIGHAKAVIFDTAVNLARMLKRKAHLLDEAFLKHADPRAVQGGAICEEAAAWRERSHEAYRLAKLISDME